MKRVIIYQKDTLEDITFQTSYHFQSIIVKEKSNGIQICSFFLKDYETCQIKEWSFICMPLKEVYSFKQVKNEMWIGHDSSSDICLDSKLISKVHARIYKEKDTYFIEDCNSTNGIYLQGKRIKSFSLTNGMTFYLVNIQFKFFDSFLILSYPLQSDPIPILQHQTMSYHPDIVQPPTLNEIKQIELESYVMDRDPKKQKLFQAIGSSILILVSSLISCILMYSMYPEQKMQMLSMVFMSGSMAISFLLFGLYNRRANYQMSLEQIETNKKLYLAYLDKVAKEIKWFEKKKENEHQFLLQAIHDNKKMKPILGFEWIQGISFQYRKWNYQQANNEMIPIIEEWLNSHQVLIQNAIILDKGKYEVDGDMNWAYGLFEGICLWNRNQKVVWVTESVDDRFLCHPASIVSNTRLWIHDSKSYERVKPLLKEDMVYIIELDGYDLPNGCHVYLHRHQIKASPYTFQLIRYRSNLISIQNEETIQPFQHQKWNDSANLNVLAGFDDEHQPIWIDFSEAKDGPHGLVAGSTGYGKSEWLSNILLQLINQNSPSYFQYILIDFKGGAFGSAFTLFPHFAGMITNLDEDVSRFLKYISNFEKERQEILKRFVQTNLNGIAHIDSYNKMNRNNPLSHVFIIVDEFAQMKTQAIELLNAMKQLARIGRSLGIHLILSTQKPMGIIDDQIWANSNFHVCLKVLSKQDSKEVLHSEAAYYLQEPGEFILCTQNKEVKGKGIYIHEKRVDDNTILEVNERDEFIHPVSSISYLDEISQKISSMNIPPSYIIPPSLLETSLENEWCLYEDIELKKKVSFRCEYGKWVTILTSEPSIISKTIISSHKETIFTLNIHGVEEYVDACFFDDSLIWKLKDFKEKAVLILKVDALDKWKSIIGKKNFRIYFLIDHIKNQMFSILEKSSRMCIEYGNVENIRAFFQNYSLKAIGSIGILKRGNQFYHFRLSDQKCLVKQEKKKLIHQSNECQIGINEQYESVSWNRKNPLLICFVQKSVQPKIESLLSSWMDMERLNVQESIEQDFDVCICDLSKHPEMPLSKTFLSNQYDWDLLWVGKGCMDYAYMLKKKMPHQMSDLMYWHEDKEYALKWKEY